MECALLNDKRRITSLFWEDEPQKIVGQAGVTSIVVTPVAGQGAFVPWFEIVQHGGTTRWNGAHVSGVGYELPANEPVCPRA